MKIKDNLVKMITLIISLFLTFYMIFPSYFDFDAGPIVIKGKVYHTTDVEKLKLSTPILCVPIESFDCYYSVQKLATFHEPEVAPVTGTIILSDENYMEIINKYDDWELLTGLLPSFVMTDERIKGFSEGITEFACEDFENCWIKESYLFSEQFVIDEKKVLLVSQKNNTIYFYFS